MSEKLNIYQKLIEIRKSCKYLEKGENGPQFKYVSSSQTLAALRNKMDEHGILLVPEVVSTNVRESTIEYIDKYKKPKKTTTYFTELSMIMKWIDADDPKEIIECKWYGQGVDIAGEKGVGKALTYAEKYFMLKFFNIATDKDDPDSFQKKNAPDNKKKTQPQNPDTSGKKDPSAMTISQWNQIKINGQGVGMSDVKIQDMVRWVAKKQDKKIDKAFAEYLVNLQNFNTEFALYNKTRVEDAA